MASRHKTPVHRQNKNANIAKIDSDNYCYTEKELRTTLCIKSQISKQYYVAFWHSKHGYVRQLRTPLVLPHSFAHTRTCASPQLPTWCTQHACSRSSTTPLTVIDTFVNTLVAILLSGCKQTTVSNFNHL